MDIDTPIKKKTRDAIRRVVMEELRPYAGIQVEAWPAGDHDGDPVVYVEVAFPGSMRGVDPNHLVWLGFKVRDAMRSTGEFRFGHMRYRENAGSKLVETE